MWEQLKNSQTLRRFCSQTGTVQFEPLSVSLSRSKKPSKCHYVLGITRHRTAPLASVPQAPIHIYKGHIWQKRAFGFGPCRGKHTRTWIKTNWITYSIIQAETISSNCSAIWQLTISHPTSKSNQSLQTALAYVFEIQMLFWTETFTAHSPVLKPHNGLCISAL